MGLRQATLAGLRLPQQPKHSSPPPQLCPHSAHQRERAGLVIGAVTAGVVASGLEQAPITGRRQLLLRSPFLPSFTRPQQTHPNLMPIYEYDYEEELRSSRCIAPREMQQLLEVTYTRLAAAVEKLAESSPDLDRHLARMPNELVPNATTILGPRIGTLPTVSAGPLMLYMHAGAILPLQSADEVLSAMCRGLAPAVLDHQREVKSWTLVNNSTPCFHVYALRAAGVRWSLALALPAALWKFADSIIHIWLPRQQEYEADEVAAAFSTAAGCSPDSILTSMQRAYCAAWTGAEAAVRKEIRNWSKRQILSMLQVLLPDTNILQDSILEGAQVQRIKSAIARKMPGDVYKLSQTLDYIQAADLCAVRNPVEGWTSPHAHWLDRIARIEKLLGSNDLAGFAGQAHSPYNVGPGFASPDGYAAGLSMYSAPNTHICSAFIYPCTFRRYAILSTLSSTAQEVALLQHTQRPMQRSDLQPVFHIVHTNKHMFVSALHSFSIIANVLVSKPTLIFSWLKSNPLVVSKSTV